MARIRSGAVRAGAALAAVLAAATPAAAGPITFSSAITLSSDEFVVREQAIHERSGDDPSGQGREREVTGALSVLGYGITEKLSVFVVAPYLHKRLETSTGVRRASGLGDLRLFGRFTVLRGNWTARAFRAALFAGVETPTGEDDRSDALGRLPPSVQPGSGSWDPFGGVVATWQTLDFQIDGQLAYQANTEAGGFEFGDVARADASFQYRLWPRELAGGLPGFLYGVVDANLVHAGRNRIGGVADVNSGGATLFVAPGLQYVTRRWIVEAAVQLPVVQNRNGAGLESGVALRAGFRFNF
jgi:hypothetical protein